MLRRVEPELLDHLAGDDPEAVRSRRELRWINFLMGNHRWLARRVRALRQPEWRVLELGAGDGYFGARLVRQGLCAPQNLIGLDLGERPERWPAGARWERGDVLKTPLPEAEIVVANLFLHHFEANALRKLGERLPGACRAVYCCEPARRVLHLVQGRFLANVARLGRVTRHDMPVSICAGFRGKELAEALGLTKWRCKATGTFFGAYQFTALR